VVGGLASQPVSALTMAVRLVAVVVGFGAWWTYFDFAGQRLPRPEPVPSVQWILGHLPLTAAVAAMGPQWSAWSTTPMTAEPQRPRRGC
jgi:low temperature requirement protein LtrA